MCIRLSKQRKRFERPLRELQESFERVLRELWESYQRALIKVGGGQDEIILLEAEKIVTA